MHSAQNNAFHSADGTIIISERFWFQLSDFLYVYVFVTSCKQETTLGNGNGASLPSLIIKNCEPSVTPWWKVGMALASILLSHACKK